MEEKKEIRIYCSIILLKSSSFLLSSVGILLCEEGGKSTDIVPKDGRRQEARPYREEAYVYPVMPSFGNRRGRRELLFFRGVPCLNEKQVDAAGEAMSKRHRLNSTKRTDKFQDDVYRQATQSTFEQGTS